MCQLVTFLHSCIQRFSRACIQNKLVKIHVVTTESTFLRNYSKSRMDTGRYSWKRDGFLRIFQKELTLYGPSYYDIEEGSPTLLHKWVYRNEYKKIRQAKRQCICPQFPILQNCVYEYGWKESIHWFDSRISLFRIQALGEKMVLVQQFFYLVDFKSLFWERGI